jgi:hypothetical protein
MHTLATLFALILFPMQCSDSYNLLLSTVGKTCNAVVGAMSKDNIFATVNGDLWMMLIRPKAPPLKVLGVKVWPRAKPTPV